MPVFTFKDTKFQRDDMACQMSHRGPGRAGGDSWAQARASGIQGETRATSHKLPLETGHGREICYRTHYENITSLAQWSHSSPALGASFLPASTSCSCWAEESHRKGFWTWPVRANLPLVMIAKYILHWGSRAIPRPLGSRT